MLQLKQAFQIYNESQEGISPKDNGNEQLKKKKLRHNLMVRYDDTALDDYPGPLFVCKNCLKVSLNKDAANSHLNSCTRRSKNVPTRKVLKEETTRKTVQNAITKSTKAPKALKDPDAPKARPRPIVSPEPYICTCCNFAFKRKVTYDQHIREKNIQHFMSDSMSTSSDESESPQMRRKYDKKMIKRDPTFYPDDGY
ncbi:uncharacterized protein LOC100573873 [Acyrthosiphon pisum]|uniref:Uncharacterized protein n=1 Tax=Acyrthosiphon pisum TaxID=7029 RepID=A0A8R1W926_ACYPI|nr:uncharacterized protein LOC100573873 [Acyrthosiphon pisum]|eukprot:XP_003246015.1 PREDICTED: uncharacterized protein LOC100573873 isoform X1 [Acyrthosiphon pisum]